jgi:hypothetical protein
MSRRMLYCAFGLAQVLCASAAGAAGFGLPSPAGDTATVVLRVHSVYEAEETLQRRGYYDVRLERESLPYSFNACKRGVRYHIHVNYYGDLVQVDPVGPCASNGYGYYGRRSDYDRYYDRYRYRPRYDD